jgi:predicted porin
VVDIGLIWQVTAKVDLRPFYRFQYSYYPDFYAGNSRNDFLHTLGLSADYAFNSWSSIRLFLTYELLDTDSPVVQDYRKFDVGAGATAGFKF